MVLVTASGYAQEIKKEKIVLRHGAHRTGKRTDAGMARWRAYGLGQFIHWGLYSIPAGEYKGQYYTGAAEWIRSWNAFPKNVYDSLYKQFNPASFYPQQWAAMARQMGARYVTITTKHHDGFCLWPSQYTDYTIARSPYGNDVIGPLAEAYDKAGIDVYLYFSILDWHHPDWRTDLVTKEDSAAFDRFKLFVRNQLTELLQRYPQTKGLWFDGTWDKSWQKSGAYTDSLEQYLKTIRPGLIIGSRLRADDKGARHFDSNGQLMGDYEQGWERKIPKNYAEVHGNDWDCVMTIPENGWGYAQKWMGHWKTTNELLEMTARCVSLGGNFVLNFGPKADGSFRTEEITTAREIGHWMNVNNTAIYDCGYAGWEKQDWGYYTKKNNSPVVYMIVFNIPVSGQLVVKPAGHTVIERAYLLSAPQKPLTLQKRDYGASVIQLPVSAYKQPFVIVLETKEAAGQPDENKAKT